MRENLIPDVSLGTHFLNELVEMNTLYLALFPRQQQNYLNEKFFLDSPNRLLELVPEADRWTDAVRVIDAKDAIPSDRSIILLADAGDQRALIFHQDSRSFANLACEDDDESDLPLGGA
jgi:hypothetical protein